MKPIVPPSANLTRVSAFVSLFQRTQYADADPIIAHQHVTDAEHEHLYAGVRIA